MSTSLCRGCRIRRRAAPEIQAAYQQGLISARRADTLLYLSAEDQRTQLNRLLAEKADMVRRSKLAAEVIKKHITAGRRDLVALRDDLRKALSSPNKKNSWLNLPSSNR